MTRVKLPCPSSNCDFETVELEETQAEKQVDLHVKIDHATAIATATGGDGHSRPEKFPRPEISIDKSTEDWNEFLVTLEQYKEEYRLEGPQLKGGNLKISHFLFTLGVFNLIYFW